MSESEPEETSPDQTSQCQFRASRHLLQQSTSSGSDITDNGIISVIGQFFQSTKLQSVKHVLQVDAMQGIFLETSSVDVQLEVKIA